VIGLDTSIVLRLLVGEPQAQSRAAYELLCAADSPAAISDLVVSESYFALRHHYVVPHRKAVAALLALLGDARVLATGIAAEVLREMADEGPPGLMDRLIHADYEHRGASMHTFDRQAARLTNVTLLSA
jgi:predicted nucleic acid-binding protein